MPVIFDEILFDLELKRAAALDPCRTAVPSPGCARARRPLVAIAAARPSTRCRSSAALTRDALAVLRTATSGDGGGGDDALVALVAERVAERLRGGAPTRRSS